MRNFLSFILLFLLASCSRKPEATTENRVVRCAVIGGMTMTGLWPEIARMFEAETGYRVEVVVTGPRPERDQAQDDQRYPGEPRNFAARPIHSIAVQLYN